MREPGAASPTAADADALASLRRRRAELGEGFPRVALFLFGSSDPALLRKTLERLPEPLDECLEEVVAMHDGPAPAAPAARDLLLPGRRLAVVVHRNPRDYGHGGARKAAFEYALRRGFDAVAVMRADGVHPPEALPRLLHAALVLGHPLVFASRLRRPRLALRSELPAVRVAAQLAASALQNRILGLRIRDYTTSFRVYPARALAHVPFQLLADDRRFDVEIVLQLRALGLEVHEVEVAPAWREGPSAASELAHVRRALAAALGYRAHQLHLTRRGRYLIDHGVHYTFKRSPTGSHVQILEAIRPGTRVLDLGCSQGLLARPLLEKGVRLVGVDSRAAQGLAPELEAYYQRDLEQRLEIPEGRDFDYVVCADVIEHLRQRTELLRSARRYLKEGGRLLISTPNVALWFYRLSLLFGRFEYGPRGVLDRSHVHLYTRATFRREVERAGFHVVRERVTALPFEVVFESTGRSRLLQAASALYHRLARLWPEMLAYQFILEAEITTLDEEAVSANPPAGP
jgi:2-polyprenyl-3-methyl-5-hydroxy-6-metoxy-1,4-benzoquinol methylase